jgi:hypothetical protein
MNLQSDANLSFRLLLNASHGWASAEMQASSKRAARTPCAQGSGKGSGRHQALFAHKPLRTHSMESNSNTKAYHNLME